MGVTLFAPPASDPAKSQIESILELTPVADIGPDVYTNTRPLWHPPGARGIYGGAVIAQSLAAAQRTVADQFYPHSMHCYFVLAGDSELPVIYHVERVRDGRSFATRTVQARQRGRVIFTATMSFDRVAGEAEMKKKRKLEHASQMPNFDFPDESTEEGALGKLLGHAPLEAIRDVHTTGEPHSNPADRSVYHFVRSRPHITEEGGTAAHLSAFAYMSDSSFIGTVSQVHNIPRFSSIANLRSTIYRLKNPSDIDHQALEAYFRELETKEADRERRKKEDQALASADQKQAKRNGFEKEDWEMGMVVSMDHTIYFHSRHGFRADQWMLVEMYSPWAGEERGLVIQNAWARDGTLIATCVQEGIMRMKQPVTAGSDKAKL
ncbi:hypothetical protein KEM52_000098 [Ascosphaera acerosa]|nr:hypothetical protein KEM52_000098 [Ascosphaera acerosa]